MPWAVLLAQVPDDVLVKQRPEGFHALNPASNQLDVLPRHRLLRQSGGVEGAFWPGKALERENNTTVNRPEVSVRDHQVDVATPGTRVNVDEGHDSIFTVEEFLGLPDQPVESAAVFLGKSHHLFATPASPGVRRQARVPVSQCDFGIGVAKQRIPVAAVERPVHGAHELHVLLRHRYSRSPAASRASCFVW
jgi:hypothetical protein